MCIRDRCWGRLARPLLALLLVVTALAHWYMTRFAVVFDAEMIRNVLHTDVAESRELMTLGMLLHVVLLGIVPAIVVLLTRNKPRSWKRGVLVRGGFLLAMLLLAGAAVGVSSQGVFSLMRTDKVLRYKITPGNYIVSLINVIKPDKKANSGPRKVVGADAKRPATAATRKPRLFVLAVGETCLLYTSRCV